jgi:hypothetical protein
VSQSLAVLTWPAEDPRGKTFELDDGHYTIVGVSGNARVTALENGDAVEGYFLADAGDLPSVVVLVKTAGAPEGLVPTLVSLAKGIDPKILPQVQLMKTSFRAAIGIFAATAALAAVLPARRALRVDPLRALRCD